MSETSLTPATSVAVDDDGRAALLDVVRNEFGRVVYSHKTHEKMADRLVGRLRFEQRLNAFLIAATAGNTVAVLVTDAQVAAIVSLGCSAAALALTIYGLSRGRERLVDAHRQTASALWLLREQYLHLIAALRARMVTVAEGRATAASLVERVHQVYTAAPPTDAAAYAEAQRALKHREEFTFSDAEIDAFLPVALRSTTS